MADVNETRLPGIGVRHDFECRSGARLAVVTRHSGRREVAVYAAKDPDRVAASAELTADESQVLAELLGGTRIIEQLNRVVQEIEGLSIDWLPLPPDFAARTIGATELRRRTGVSIIAIVREDHPVPAPGPDDELRAGDTVLVAGTADGLTSASALLGV